MAPHSSATPTRTDAISRAQSLVSRAHGLRRAQAEVQELTVREVAVMAKTASSFFDSLPLVELTPSLMPHSVNRLHKIRHRIVQRTIEETGTGMVIRALLLGRDGTLRLFTARSVDSRDLLQILEPGRVLPAGVTRDVVDWSPLLRVEGFRPFEILDKLSGSLDVVEEQLTVAEERVAVQKAALTSGNLKALMPQADVVRQRSDSVRALSSGAVPSRNSPEPTRIVATPQNRDPYEVFERVEAVAASPTVIEATMAPESADEPEEWDDPQPSRMLPPLGASGNDRVVK